MSALTEVEDVAVNGLWKVGAVLLAILLLATAGGMGFEWWEAAHDRDLARADLKAERETTALLRSAVDTQNAAIDGLAAAKRAAEEKGAAAQQLAAVNGKRYDKAQAALTGTKATTCTDAMPAVNKLLEDLR